jgi:pilus assembly protein Flp/PilA
MNLQTIVNWLQTRDDESGAALVEYSLLVALIAVFCIGAMSFLAGGIDQLFTDITGNL